ncbi:4144_t:CDS:1, partial [Acaulospora morrowiae]
MANTLLSRELPKSLSFRNAFVNFTVAPKRPFHTSVLRSFACKNQPVNTRTKLAATQFRAYSLEQTTQLTPDKPIHKTENNNQSKHASSHANEEKTDSKFMSIHPIFVILAASVGFAIYKYYTSAVFKYPIEIRKILRKGLYYHQRDPNRAVTFYQTALTQALNHEELDNASPEVTGIMIQLGSLYEELGRIRDAIDVLTMAYDIIVTPDNIPVKLEGEIKIRSISLAQKLGDLHQNLRQHEQAEKYYVWSVEQLLQSQQELSHNRSGFFSRKEGLVLPSWMTSTDLGASLEALASFYSSQHKYA